MKNTKLNKTKDWIPKETTKEKKMKAVKKITGWAVFEDNRLIDVWVKKPDCEKFKTLEIKLGGFYKYTIVQVLITPIIKKK